MISRLHPHQCIIFAMHLPVISNVRMFQLNIFTGHRSMLFIVIFDVIMCTLTIFPELFDNEFGFFPLFRTFSSRVIFPLFIPDTSLFPLVRKNFYGGFVRTKTRVIQVITVLGSRHAHIFQKTAVVSLEQNTCGMCSNGVGIASR